MKKDKPTQEPTEQEKYYSNVKQILCCLLVWYVLLVIIF